MKMPWTKVSDKMPELGIAHRYLFVNGKGEVTFGYGYDWDNDGTYVWIHDIDRDTNETATHWMYIPEWPNE
jgi:Protein of unknown function (DUF551)